MGREDAVIKAVQILLDNAAKYANDGGRIEVSLRKTNKTVLVVYNTGAGIEETETKLIFERFYRSDASRSRETGGSGLGLSILSSLAAQNKWKLYVETHPGKDIAFSIVF